MVSDDFGKAKTSGKQLLALINNTNKDHFTGKSHDVWKTLQNEIKSELQPIEHFTQLDEIRNAFVNLSNTIISLANAFKPNETLFVLHCPMANNNKGADWLSSSKEIKNPYYGKAMLTCGEVKDTININK